MLELQQQQHSHAEAVRALHAQLSLSQLEARSNRQECETADLKCGKLVRLIAMQVLRDDDILLGLCGACMYVYIVYSIWGVYLYC